MLIMILFCPLLHGRGFLIVERICLLDGEILRESSLL